LESTHATRICTTGQLGLYTYWWAGWWT